MLLISFNNFFCCRIQRWTTFWYDYFEQWTCCTLCQVVESRNIEHCKIWMSEQKEQVVSSWSQLKKNICTLKWIFCFPQSSLFFTLLESMPSLTLFAPFFSICLHDTSMISVLFAILLLVFYSYKIPTDSSHLILLIKCYTLCFIFCSVLCYLQNRISFAIFQKIFLSFFYHMTYHIRLYSVMTFCVQQKCISFSKSDNCMRHVNIDRFMNRLSFTLFSFFYANHFHLSFCTAFRFLTKTRLMFISLPFSWRMTRFRLISFNIVECLVKKLLLNH